MMVPSIRDHAGSFQQADSVCRSGWSLGCGTAPPSNLVEDGSLLFLPRCYSVLVNSDYFARTVWPERRKHAKISPLHHRGDVELLRWYQHHKLASSFEVKLRRLEFCVDVVLPFRERIRHASAICRCPWGNRE
jgi:hypothetical protein